MLQRVDQEDLVREVARAPTADNTQPARWRFTEKEVVLYLAEERRLEATDPNGVHTHQSMGSSFEGMSIALSRRSLGLGPCRLAVPGAATAGPAPYARADLVEGARTDPLAKEVWRRHTYRGLFQPGDPGPIREFFAGTDDVTIVSDRGVIHSIAQHYDGAVAGLFVRPGYAREMYGWMRFRRGHPDWGRDGLRADCMDLTPFKALAASIVMRPRVFEVISRLGLGRAVLSEAAKIRSSTVLAAFHPSTETGWFDVGRRFYRLCLEVTSLGFAACPLSAIADHPDHQRAVHEMLECPGRLANVFRIGPRPTEGPPQSSRLPAPEFLV